ncbi:MAG: UDP-N-acetylmuramoyl-L-alanine--D-glutamate ligase [Candidatus Levyibacteriota bacterium]
MADFKGKPHAAKALRGKKIAVLGSGVEGASSLEFLQNQGANVTVLDEKIDADYLKDLDQYDLIVRSPGIKLEGLEKYGDKVTSQTKIFFDLCPCPIIGVTGTKGKGTTASLIYEMLKEEGRDTYLGGNIGVPPLLFLGKLKKTSIVVLELSSFQLMDLSKNPHIAVMLMTTSEHLNWHKDIFEYVDAKRNILRFQNESDYAIVNKDYPASRESDAHTNGQVFYVSREDEIVEGCFVKGDKVTVRRGGIEEEIIDTSEILLPGKHNWENVCAATMVAIVAGVNRKNIAKVLRTFKGLGHRLELVAEVDGIRYYDDSFSTTPETAIAAIEAFSEPEILILGGSSKNSDFKELGQVIFERPNVKAIIGVGEEWEKIKAEIKTVRIKYVEGCVDMKEIIKSAQELAEDGDVVLLSPACASFGMFANYKDRGEQFKREVFSLL